MKRGWLSGLLSLLGVVVLLAPLPASTQVAEAPPQLALWRDWVLQELPQLACPPRHDRADGIEAEARHCAYAGVLELRIDAAGGRFEVDWWLLRAGWVPLPGSAEAWPDAVRSEREAVAVIARDGLPWVWLEGGRQRLQGELRWAERPQRLAVPASIARLGLTLDGAPVALPQRRGGQLWLGDGDAVAGQADTLDLQVYRLLADELPARLSTRLQLTVTGRARELALPPLLPQGFVATALTGSLPHRLQADGGLQLQLAPGQHQIELQARASAPLQAVAPPQLPAPWPAQEVWSFRPGQVLAPAEPTGGEPVDPQQAGVPPDWQGEAAFLLTPASALTLQRSELSLALLAPNVLRLQRELWLDFDAAGWRFTDQLSGNMRQGWRLDALPMLPLQRAESLAGGSAEPLLLTLTPDGPADSVGVEWRDGDIALRASGRLPAGGVLPASGWQAPLEQLTLSLNLPPGWQLLAAFGVDQAGSAWVARWRLGQIFLLCLGALLAYRLAGWRLVVPAVLYLALSNGQAGAPLFTLLLVLLLLLGLRWVAAPTPRRWLRIACWPALGVLLLHALPYAAGQVTLLLHPQLERAGVESQGFNAATSSVMDYSARRAPQDDGDLAFREQAPQALENVAPMKAAPALQQQLNRVDPKAIVQAGGAAPQWRWHVHRLQLSGPVQPEQQLRLLLAPPWLTALWRLLAVLALTTLLAAASWQLLGRRQPPRWLAFALLLPLGAGAQASSSEFPDQALLDAYRQRLTAPAACVPDCVALQGLRVQAIEQRLVLELELHLVADLSVPLPHGEGWQPARLLVDGEPREGLWQDAGVPYLPLQAGVRRVRLEGLLVPQRLRLSLPLSPARVDSEASGWLVNGIERGRLPGGQLELVRLAPAANTGGQPSGAGAEVPAYVAVQRSLSIDLDWTLVTTVSRIAPVSGALQVQVPLLQGEQLLSSDPPVQDGQVRVTLRDGQQQLSYASRLPGSSQLSLTAPPLAERVERWEIAVSPIFHVRFEAASGLLARGGSEPVQRFDPLPGDRLTLQVSRPQAVAGSTLAIDGVGLRSRLGTRLRDSELSFQLRATRGGQHLIQLPPAAELLRLSVDGREIRLRPEQGRLQLPVRPGSQLVRLELREPWTGGMRADFPAIDLGLPAANVGLVLSLPADRWVLWTAGPPVGPAVRFWSVLALVLVLAWLLGRSGRGGVSTRDALVLGIGLATVAWWAMLLVAAWLWLLDWRRQQGARLGKWRFDGLQLLLLGLSVVVVLVLAGSVWSGLLGRPEMWVQGNGSSATRLIWFADQASGPLPTAFVFSAPMWLYKLAILLWSLWLAQAVIGWLRRALDALATGGWWKPLRRPPPPPAAPSNTPPQPETPS